MLGVNMTFGVPGYIIDFFLTNFWGGQWTESQDFPWKKENNFFCNDNVIKRLYI